MRTFEQTHKTWLREKLEDRGWVYVRENPTPWFYKSGAQHRQWGKGFAYCSLRNAAIKEGLCRS